jgi:hypothetical protein
MKTITKSVAVAGVTMLAVATMLGKGGGGQQQPVHTVKFTFKVAFTNTGVEPGASGTAQGSESVNAQKNTDQETLNIMLKGLQTNSPYSLFATAIDGTNSDAADFTTDKKGNAKLSLSSKSSKNGFPIGSLDPLTLVTELDIVNATTSETVLTADTTAPQTFTFTDKQTQSGTNGETGTLTINASNKSSKLSLSASGLVASNGYLLALNGTPTTNDVFTSTSKGTLKINTAIPSDVLDLTEVDLLDTSNGNNPVLTFPLP